MDALNLKDTLQIIGLVISFIVLVNGPMIWAVKWLLERSSAANTKHIDESLNGLRQDIDKFASRIERLERDYQKFREDLIRDYVRREELVRQSVSIDMRLDKISRSIEGINRRGAKRDETEA